MLRKWLAAVRESCRIVRVNDSVNNLNIFVK